MGSVGTPVVRRMIQVAHGDRDALLASVGLTAAASPVEAADPSEGFVEEDAYYGLIERIIEPGDPEFPFRYADALHPDDLGALGLALKTAPTVRGALERLARYILVLSDTLEYELVDVGSSQVFALTGRPHHRRGAAVANECALAAATSALRQIVGSRLTPTEVSFRHDAPETVRHHEAYFGCAVRFGAERDGILLDRPLLDRRTLLADEGLSTYLLAQLDDLRSGKEARSLSDDVRAAVADSLPDGQPSKARVARRLGMSERTLHRRLADRGETFQTLVERVRREVAESLLGSTDHPLADVAFLTGFADQTAFTRAFKRWTGTTPAAFRNTGT